MSQIFNRSTNAISRLSIWGAVFILAGVTWAASVLNRSAYNTNQGVTIRQPIPFGHVHHVAGLGIDCRYCHTFVERLKIWGILFSWCRGSARRGRAGNLPDRA